MQFSPFKTPLPKPAIEPASSWEAAECLSHKAAIVNNPEWFTHLPQWKTSTALETAIVLLHEIHICPHAVTLISSHYYNHCNSPSSLVFYYGISMTAYSVSFFTFIFYPWYKKRNFVLTAFCVTKFAVIYKVDWMHGGYQEILVLQKSGKVSTYANKLCFSRMLICKPPRNTKELAVCRKIEHHRVNIGPCSLPLNSTLQWLLLNNCDGKARFEGHHSWRAVAPTSLYGESTNLFLPWCMKNTVWSKYQYHDKMFYMSGHQTPTIQSKIAQYAFILLASSHWGRHIETGQPLVSLSMSSFVLVR